MKKFTEIIGEGKNELNIQEETINFIPSKDLETYLKICNKFISNESKDIISYLILNNNTYIKNLSNGNNENALKGFYDAGVPKDESLKLLYKNIGIINKRNRLLEIPVFQTEEQFNAIINKEISPDEILLDLVSERGRNECVKKYNDLINKIVNQFVGKSKFSREELLSAAYEGFTDAMNNYGKRSNKTRVEDEKIVTKTFLQYAGQQVRFRILEDIKDLSHLVRVPRSQQKKEKEQKGYNTRDFSVSGDEGIGKDKEGNNRSMWDVLDVGLSDNSGPNKEDEEILINKIYELIEKHFDAKTLDIWKSCMDDREGKKMKKIDVGKKYGLSPSHVKYYLNKVNGYIQSNKEIMDLFHELYECVQDDRRMLDDQESTHYIVSDNSVYKSIDDM